MTIKHRARRSTTGFTLVEILIVVVLLGILAAIVVPQFSDASGDAKRTAVEMDLRHIRMQLELYRVQHGGTIPGLVTFEQQMTLSSNIQGQTAAIGTAGYPLGPYVQKIPVNPYTNTNDITAGVAGASAWYYDETTGDFRANDSEASRAY